MKNSKNKSTGIIGKLKFKPVNESYYKLINNILLNNGCKFITKFEENQTYSFIFVDEYGGISLSNYEEDFENSDNLNIELIVDGHQLLFLTSIPTVTERDCVYLLDDLNALVIKQGDKLSNFYLPKTKSTWVEFSKSLLEVSFITELNNLM